VIEAVDPTHIHLTSMLYIYKVFDNLYMLWMCIWMCLPTTLRLAVMGVAIVRLDVGVAVVGLVVVGPEGGTCSCGSCMLT